MKEEYICPCCGKDISEYVHESVVKYIRRRNVEKARAERNRDPEVREEMNRQSAERLHKWRKANPKLVRAISARAKDCRTAETFARQSETMKETIRRKTVKFAQLVLEAKNAGREITPELEKQLLLQARDIVRSELKAERRAAKRSSNGV